MDSIDQLLSEKSSYKNLKSNIYSIIDKLNSVIENLETPAHKINKIYSIDLIGVDKGKINTSRENLISNVNYLKNNVIPSINNTIKNIEYRIEELQRAEEEEEQDGGTYV